MIAAHEHDHLAAPREGSRSGQLIIRLASVPEFVKRTVSIEAKRSHTALAETRFEQIVAAQIQTVVERRVDSRANLRMRVAIDAALNSAMKSRYS